ncbi:hypothetical protein CCMA1212_006119 [Trichoderma ghanense]|uniref:Uncharacterized protein n=1 Tax=Trichoderma ghanense TaxID=65468 RepID=A0ABY2H313_9HYPO
MRYDEAIGRTTRRSKQVIVESPLRDKLDMLLFASYVTPRNPSLRAKAAALRTPARPDGHVVLWESGRPGATQPLVEAKTCGWAVLVAEPTNLMELLLAPPTGGQSPRQSTRRHVPGLQTLADPKYLSPNLQVISEEHPSLSSPHAANDSTAPRRDSPSGDSQGSQQEPRLGIQDQEIDQ